ncbi:MAG TPA: hypothetical protein PK024_09100 [Methanospirillum sp.]|uniref:hypothetical protein n=1 Tax=Methanospirillum sp. TaxID=45200 RepID=UPI002C8AFC93|nr:hypothetical protein [Methanospirillum sp.]HOJ96974.1 hypothetical protein [Methanospirillum sp.]HOL41775.1 hypothetical protein [Methanospirillum sp.]HPP78401.1 hypothetical protein [Methanospirillum sp.]
MKLSIPDRYICGSFVLLIVAGMCAGIVSLSERRDIISAALLVSAVILFLTAILLFVLHRPDSVDERFVSLLQVQGAINICMIAADLGISGLSCFLPESRTECQSVMHLIPVARYTGEPVDGLVFISGEGFSGLLLPPVCIPLLEELQKTNQLIIPKSQQELSTLLHEIAIDVLEVASEIMVSWSATSVQIHMEGYRLYEGCRAVFRESPACCTMSPCVICSLFATVIAKGLDRPVQVDRCVPVKKDDSVEMIYTLLP